MLLHVWRHVVTSKHVFEIHIKIHLKSTLKWGLLIRNTSTNVKTHVATSRNVSHCAFSRQESGTQTVNWRIDGTNSRDHFISCHDLSCGLSPPCQPRTEICLRSVQVRIICMWTSTAQHIGTCTHLRLIDGCVAPLSLWSLWGWGLRPVLTQMSVANKRSAMKHKENFSTGTLMAPATPRIQAGKFSEPKSSEPPGEALKTSKYQLSVSGKKIGYGHRVCGLDLGGVQEIPNLATTAECSWGTSFTTHICFLAISLTSHFWILILRLTCQA